MSPAVSKSQRKAMGMAKAIQEGKMEAKPGSASAKMAEMDPESLEHYAKTKEKGLPMHKGRRRMGMKKGMRKPQGVRSAGMPEDMQGMMG